MARVKSAISNFFSSFMIYMEIIAYQKTLRDCHGYLRPEQIEHIRKQINELSKTR